MWHVVGAGGGAAYYELIPPPRVELALFGAGRQGEIGASKTGDTVCWVEQEQADVVVCCEGTSNRR